MQRPRISCAGVRQGIHTAEVELVGDDVRGIAVHEAARIAAAASPGEILVSSTTKVLAEGIEVAFLDRGEQSLRGLSGTRQLFAADPEARDAEAVSSSRPSTRF